ncbi:MAG TPA: cytochrome c [Candidatus Binataceae bacterium]|jgi:mono/diheme cytochrome c family protein|nr:cytochrome c [Candidatus Binataceae bacterium]
MRNGYARLLVAIILPAALVSLSAAGALAGHAQASDKQAVERGRNTFNGNCAHCHGEDAATDDPYFNLPQLLSDKSDAFFFKTVSNGLADKGMPPWKTVLKRRQMEDILSFLRSVEQEQGLTDNSGGGD